MDKKEIGENALAVLRIMIGWLFLWPFFDKLFGLGFQTEHGKGMIDGGSPSSYVEYMTRGPFEAVFKAIAGNAFIDYLMMAALLILGITLIFGIASKLTTIGASAFVLIMFCIELPPTDNPLFDYHITWIAAFIVILYLGGFERLSVYRWWKELPIVKRFPILE